MNPLRSQGRREWGCSSLGGQLQSWGERGMCSSQQDPPAGVEGAVAHCSKTTAQICLRHAMCSTGACRAHMEHLLQLSVW